MLLGFALEANCAVLDSQFIAEEVKKELISQLQQNYSGEIEVNVKYLPYKSVKIPNGNLKIKAELKSDSLNSQSIAKVSIYVNNTKIKSFGAKIVIRIKDKVWVAKDWIKRGQSLTCLTLEEKEITSVSGNLPGKDFLPRIYRARRNIKPGEVIKLKNIEKIPTVVKNSPVSVTFKTSMVSVTIPCTAVTSGSTGDFIKVKSKKFRKNYIGKIIGKNLILVNI